MTRAMLYAGSTANYFETLNITPGPAINGGLMGMKRSQAAEFYEYVIEAAELIERGGYRLHDGVNKEVAFTEVFTEDLNGIEDLFVKLFGPYGSSSIYNSRLHHSWDSMVLPLGTGLASDVGSALHPAWDLIKLYQMRHWQKRMNRGNWSRPI